LEENVVKLSSGINDMCVIRITYAACLELKICCHLFLKYCTYYSVVRVLDNTIVYLLINI